MGVRKMGARNALKSTWDTKGTYLLVGKWGRAETKIVPEVEKFMGVRRVHWGNTCCCGDMPRVVRETLGDGVSESG